MAAQTVTYSGRSILTNRIKGNGTEPKNAGWGTGSATGSANGDVNLFVPATESRVAGTSTLLTTTQLADTYQVTATITAAGGKTITEVGLFDTNAALSPTTTVTGSLTSGATGSQVVASSTGFPAASSAYYVQIDNEVIVAHTVDSTHISLDTRGALGSTAASHSAGAVITLGGDGGAGTGGATSAQVATVGSAQGGNMYAHADFGGIVLAINDSIAFTVKDQFT